MQFHRADLIHLMGQELQSKNLEALLIHKICCIIHPTILQKHV